MGCKKRGENSCPKVLLLLENLLFKDILHGYNQNKTLRRKLKSTRPSPISFKFCKTFVKINGVKSTRKDFQISKKAIRATSNSKLNRKVKQTTSRIMRNKINSLSPQKRNILSFIAGQAIETNKRVKRHKQLNLQMKQKFRVQSPPSSNTSKRRHHEEIFDPSPPVLNTGTLSPKFITKFDQLHYKLKDLKSSPGVCQSSFMLNKKLKEIHSNKEGIHPEGKLFKVFNNNFINEVRFKQELRKHKP
ncbi:unnamed protein product [Moneuplotes crassus]|uniref:Uncharacterized protein n=1 Tax=Euplotes crassus TaxID=5936 RepID=A0AAD1UJI4_EUPCR|nr:unnamed protein product [Moneuplotes crassus]